MLRMIMLLLLALPLAAQAQTTYRCTSKDGKKYYGSTIPMQCMGVVVEQPSKQGTVIKRIDPHAAEKEKAEKEAAAKKKEEDVVSREEQRRNRALLATYTSERDIEEARQRALADNQKAVAEVQAKIDTIKRNRAKYDKELEFYQDKNKKGATPPAKLAQDIKNSEIDLKAQEDLLTVKQKEVVAINARYDEDKKRYIELKKKGTSASR